MRRLTGQAAWHCARVLHGLATVAFLAVVVTASATAVLAWRLSQGPMDARWLARRFEAAVNAQGGPTRLTIGSAAVAWEGFRHGVDMPLDIRLTGVSATDEAGVQIADMPRAAVSLSPGALLLGRLRPRGIDVEHPRLRLLRTADGAISLDLGSLVETEEGLASDAPDTAGPGLLPGLVTELARPAGNDRNQIRTSLIAQLRRLRVRDATITVVDQQLGATWRVPRLDVELDRLTQGGLEGRGEAELALGDQRTTLRMTAALAPGTTRTQIAASLGPVEPAALARASRVLAPLSAVEAPISVSVQADLGPQFAIRSGAVQATAGAGKLRLGAGAVQLTGGSLDLVGSGNEVTLRALRLGVRARDGGTLSQVQVHAEGRRSGGSLRAEVTADLDQAAFADMAALWPPGVGHGARSWVTQNITAGMARNAHVEARLEAPDDLSDIGLVGATGTIGGDGLTIHWLRPIPPVEHAQAKLVIVDADTLEIVAEGGQQHSDVPRGDPLTIRGGKVRITGIEHRNQFGDIDADLTGGIAETIALLKNPRLHLLDTHPMPGRDLGGKAAVKLSVQLPFEDDVRIDDIAIHARAHLTDARVADLVAGRDLDQGTLDVDATAEEMRIDGNARLAGIATDLGIDMDFRAGPPSQTVRKVSAAGRATAQQLAAAGLDSGGLLSGAVDLQAVLTERRDGSAVVQADADLGGAELSAAPVAWHKPAGSPARLSARVLLEHDRLSGIDAVSLEGKDLAVRGAADFSAGRVSALRLDRVMLGLTQAKGIVRFPPAGQRRPIEASFDGPVIDLSALTEHRPRASGGRSDAEAPPGPPWSLDAHFGRAIMAGQRNWLGIAARAENDGSLLARLSVSGQTGPGRAFRLEVSPGAAGRLLSASAADAGALLAGLDLVGTMQGGQLALSGAYDDRRSDHALTGTAEITDFRVKDPNGLGRLLQAMTLYGLVEAASGPGLGFTRLTAPFRLTEDALELGASRAFSPSLGLTAKGRIDLRRNTAAIEGTVVPAYFFNSMLGTVPLIGRLFSPEAGGGLFAATYTVHGPLDDPKVSVNPLATLTPGFLRGVFGLF